MQFQYTFDNKEFILPRSEDGNQFAINVRRKVAMNKYKDSTVGK